MTNLHPHKTYEFEGFRLDAAHLLLYRNGREISLAPKVVETLLALVKRCGEVLSKDELMEIVWTDSIVEEGNLSQNLYLLRKTLGKTADGKPLIETLHRRGYRFNGDVVCIEAKTAENFLPDKTQSAAPKDLPSPHQFSVERQGNVFALADWKTNEQPETGDNQTRIFEPAEVNDGVIQPIADQRGIAAGLIILLLASIGLGYWFFNNRPSNAAAIESIAVLPFENASGDADLDYLSDGLSESVIDRLAQLSQLKVIARSSSFKYRGENIDVQDVANKLGVQAIVTGRVVQRGDNLSIRVEMVDARDNKQLWGEQYNRRAADALAIQQEIAQTVSEKLRLKLSGAEKWQIAKSETVNPQAYELLLRGDFSRTRGGQENWKKAPGYYEQAIAVDPNYALAYTRLSRIYIILASASVVDPKEFIPKAQAAARKALELDENLADAHLAMGDIYLNVWDWAAAEAEFKRAIELNPNLAKARQGYSFYLSIIGRHEQALAEAKRARELDPLSIFTNLHVGKTLFIARRYDEAIVETKKIVELDNGYSFAIDQLSYIYAAKGMHREAVAAYEELTRLGGTNSPNISFQIYRGAAYARAGEREKAQAILKQLETSKEYVSPGELPVLYIALGEREKAFASFEKAYAAHDLQLQNLTTDPAYDPLRDDPRFQDLLRRVGLPQ